MQHHSEFERDQDRERRQGMRGGRDEGHFERGHERTESDDIRARGREREPGDEPHGRGQPDFGHHQQHAQTYGGQGHSHNPNPGGYGPYNPGSYGTQGQQGGAGQERYGYGGQGQQYGGQGQQYGGHERSGFGGSAGYGGNQHEQHHQGQGRFGGQGAQGDYGRERGNDQGSLGWGRRDEGSRGMGSSGDSMPGRGGFAGRGGFDESRDEGSRGQFRGKGPKDWTRSDERIREEVCELLADADDIDASNITVKVEKGEVILEGTVDSRAVKRETEDLIWRARGVKDCQNHLRVKSDTESTSMGRDANKEKEPGNGHAGRASQAGASTTGNRPTTA